LQKILKGILHKEEEERYAPAQTSGKKKSWRIHEQIRSRGRGGKLNYLSK
jgi:hypothetical protein